MSAVYLPLVPKLWDDTIEGHRRAVRDATLDATAELVARHGLRSVTMSQIAETAGVGRATLYKYFPDVESILAAWHQRQIAQHLAELAALKDGAGSPGERVRAVLEAYAFIRQGMRHELSGPDLAGVMHSGGHVAHAQEQLSAFVSELLTEGAAAGEIRDDVAPRELAAYCLHALAAATALPSKAAVRRLVDVTVTGLRPVASSVAAPQRR